MIFRVITIMRGLITIIYAGITMISKQMIMSGEILTNSSEKLFKIDSHLVMIALAQDGNATQLNKISGVQHNIV